MKALQILLWVLAGVAGAIALLFLGVAILGNVGIFADVSYDENKAMGMQALWIGLGAQGTCMVFLLLALLLMHRSAKAKPSNL